MRASALLVRFDLMMDLTSEFEWRSNAAKRLRCPADSADYHATVTECPAEQALFDVDAFDFRQ